MYWIMEFCVALSLALDNYEQKYCQTLGKLISQTIHTTCCCCKDDYFPKRKFKKINGLFHSVYPVFPKSLFSIADWFAVRDLRVICTRS